MKTRSGEPGPLRRLRRPHLLPVCRVNRSGCILNQITAPHA